MMIKKSRFWEDTHGTGRSHVALPYPVPRVHFSADRTDTSVIVREVLGCLNALVCRPNRYKCKKRPPPGEEKSILGGLQGAGACSRPRGSPGQHARLWVVVVCVYYKYKYCKWWTLGAPGRATGI